MLAHGALTERVIGLAIEVHRTLGPGLLESAYEECVCWELQRSSIAYARQVPLPVIYKSIRLDCTYQMDIVVEQSVILEIKAVEHLRPLHDAQLLTYLRLSGYPVGVIPMALVADARPNGGMRFAFPPYGALSVKGGWYYTKPLHIRSEDGIRRLVL